MKLSLKWLSDHVDVSDFLENPEVLADKLTDVGLEVEEVENKAKAYDHVVVGEITHLGKHPDADKLTYCDVNVGDETLKIICGAKNHKQGDKVCVAKIGAVLPGNFKIKKSKIRGVESFGMLCSEKELGLSDESEGILILSEDAPVGLSFAKYKGLDDVFLEINVTPNRADCLSHLGLAREVSTLFKRPLKTAIEKKESESKKGKDFKVDLKNSELCPRYLGQMIYGVKVGPSPDWLKNKIESVGMNSINNIVDITNYIMLDSGQPMHAFDVAKLKGDKIIIDTAVSGEAFTSLDGTEYKLSGEELCIKDASGVIGLAGVVGGENSGVDESTQDIFLEAAHFIPSTVRKTSRALGIDTDSAYRFSRGTDISRLKDSMQEAVSLVLSVAGGVKGENLEEAYPQQKEHSAISVNLDYIEKRLGFKIESSKVEEAFKSLGFKIEGGSKAWQVTPQSFRWDIAIKEDLVEEVGRILGYDQIPEILPAFSDFPQSEKSNYRNDRSLREDFKSLGYHEAVHYNFYSSREEALKAQEILEWQSKSLQSVEIRNPLSSDLSVMRTSLVPQFVSNMIRNFRLGAPTGRIFEIGKSHFKSENKYSETAILCAGFWSEQKSEEALRSLIGDLAFVFKSWGVKSWRLDSLTGDGVFPSLLHPKLTARIVAEGKDLGFVTSLHPVEAKASKVTSSFVAFELNLDQFLKGKPRPKKFKSFSRFPIVERDFSVLVSEDYDFAKLTKLIKKSSGDYFKSVALAQEFRGDKIPQGQVSITLKVKMQASDKTLSEEDLKTLQNKIMSELEKL